jgi:hypothetical protein
MSKTSLRRMFDKPALHVFQPDNFWPMPDQFIGVEIELEGQSKKDILVHNNNGAPFWVQHQDGSLRNGVEFVLSQPMMGSTLKEAIHYFFRTFKTYDDNPRTSIHVHINMLQDDESLEGLRNFLVLYYAFEDPFFQIADEARKWNGYCNPFEDDPPDILQAIMRHDDPKEVTRYMRDGGNGGGRYYGLNLLALGRFGTLEFRHLPLVRDEQRLFDWIMLIMELKKAANRMADEALTPAQVFSSPFEFKKLPEYMPQFGEILLRYIDPQIAYIRMCNINALRLPMAGDHHDLTTNKAWQLYVETQKKSGRKSAAKTVKVKKAIPRPGARVWEDELLAADPWRPALDEAPVQAARPRLWLDELAQPAAPPALGEEAFLNLAGPGVRTQEEMQRHADQLRAMMERAAR